MCIFVYIYIYIYVGIILLYNVNWVELKVSNADCNNFVYQYIIVGMYVFMYVYARMFISSKIYLRNTTTKEHAKLSHY